MKDGSGISVLLVDDHPVVRKGLRTMLMSEPGIDVVGGASNGEEAIHKVDELEPDVVLIDIRMPGMSGNEATLQIKKAHPTTSVIVLTMYDSEVHVVEAIRVGATGYLTKDASLELVCQAVRTVVGGGTLMRSGLLRRAIQNISEKEKGVGGELVPSMVGRLTRREVDVLRLLSRGDGNKRIATELHLAEVTVKKHVQNIISKLGVSDRTHAAIFGVRLGLAD